MSLCAIVLFIFVCFAACGGDAGAAETTQADLTDDEVLALYASATEAYGWFHAHTMPFDRDQAKESGGKTYYKVTHDSIATLAGLRSYLEGMFAAGIVDELLNFDSGAEKYLDIDGALYVYPVVKQGNIYRGRETCEIARAEDQTLINVLVDVEKLNADMEPDGAEEFTFILKKTDGVWRFETFASVR